MEKSEFEVWKDYYDQCQSNGGNPLPSHPQKYDVAEYVCRMHKQIELQHHENGLLHKDIRYYKATRWIYACYGLFLGYVTYWIINQITF